MQKQTPLQFTICIQKCVCVCERVHVCNGTWMKIDEWKSKLCVYCRRNLPLGSPSPLFVHQFFSLLLSQSVGFIHLIYIYFLLLVNCAQIKITEENSDEKMRLVQRIAFVQHTETLHCTALHCIRQYFLLYNNVSIFYILFETNKEKRLDECIIMLYCVLSYRFFVCKCKLR